MQKLLQWLPSLILLAGCANTNTESSDRVRVWGIGAEGERLGIMARQFESENPDIRLEVQTIPWSAVHEKLITAVAGGTEPDMCQLGNTWMPEFHAMRALAPLDSLIAASAIVKAENYFPGSWATNVLGGSVYGVPWYVETRCLYYRTDLLSQIGFDHAPATWDELHEAVRRLARDENRDGNIDHFGMTLQVTQWEHILFFTWGADGDILESDLETPTVTSPETREAWKYYVRFFREGLAPVESGLLINLFNAFETGYYAMFISGPWMMTQVTQHCPAIAGKWEVAMMPKYRTQDSWAGGSNLVIFRKSKRKEAAWRFIEYLSRPDIQLQWYRILSDLPSVKAAWEDSLLSNDPKIRVFYQQLQYTRPAPQVPEWEQIASRINRWLEVAVYGRTSVDEALQGLSEDISRIMRKRGRSRS
jgi:multiple sugar transport system substrate-binding protein